MSRLLILYLCSLTLRSLVLAGLAGVATLRMRSVAGRHAVWTAVLACMLLMPLADALLPASFIPARAPEIVLPVQTFVVVPSAVVAQPRAVALAPVPEQRHRDWWQVTVLVWTGVASLFLCRLVMACGAIVRIKRTGQPVLQELIGSHDFGLRAPALRESGRVAIPLTVGFFKPVLILPLGWRDWDDWKLRAVLAHELTHVQRKDWAIAVSATLARSVFWFNPLSWWLERHLSSLAEQASDEACVLSTGDAPRYAETLLQFASVAKRGRRWIGGVAMAQYKISFRIERVLRLQKAGSGVLSKAGWIAVSILAVCTLYVSAAAQSRTTTQAPPLSPAEIVRVVRQSLPASEQLVVAGTQSAQQVPIPGGGAVNAEVLTPTARAGILRYWSSWAPSAQQPAPPAPATPAVPPVNPDLIGEIRLILAPVDQGLNPVPGQVQIQTQTGNNRYTGTAVWNVRNGALNPNTWATNGNGFTFAMTGAQGRTLSFETKQGGTFSYGCPDCSFLASELGVSAPAANSGAGIVFHLGSDGRSVTATCRAVECRVMTSTNWNPGRAPSDDTIRILKDSESLSLPVPQQPSVDPSTPGLRCFSVFGNVKADGTPFTASDCPGGVSIVPGSAVFFVVTR